MVSHHILRMIFLIRHYSLYHTLGLSLDSISLIIVSPDYSILSKKKMRSTTFYWKIWYQEVINLQKCNIIDFWQSLLYSLHFLDYHLPEDSFTQVLPNIHKTENFKNHIPAYSHHSYESLVCMIVTGRAWRRSWVAWTFCLLSSRKYRMPGLAKVMVTMMTLFFNEASSFGQIWMEH